VIPPLSATRLAEMCSRTFRIPRENMHADAGGEPTAPKRRFEVSSMPASQLAEFAQIAKMAPASTAGRFFLLR